MCEKMLNIFSSQRIILLTGKPSIFDGNVTVPHDRDVLALQQSKRIKQHSPLKLSKCLYDINVRTDMAVKFKVS